MDNSEALSKLGTHIRKLREENKLSQSQLSFMAEIAESTLFRIENGKHIPSANTLISIAKALEIPMKKLMDFNIYSENPIQDN